VSLGEAFCVVCGDSGPLTSNRLCESCFRERVTLSELTATIQSVRCPKCAMVLHSGRWVNIPDVELQHGVVQQELAVDERASGLEVGIHAEPVDERNTRLLVQAVGVIDELEFADEHTTMLQLSDGVCPSCSRRAGNYYEATVQLRSSGRRLAEDELEALRETLDSMISEMEPDPMFFISNEGAVAGGWDVVLGSKALARAWGRYLTRRYGSSTKESNTVVGRKDGEEITRLTVLYRKPAFDLGDVIHFRKGDWIVAGWQKDGALLHALDRRERIGASWRDLEKSRVRARVKDHLDVDLLNRDSSGGEFLDPRDWQVRTVSLPFDDEGSSMRLRIALIGDEWVALPDVRRNPGGGEDE